MNNYIVTMGLGIVVWFIYFQYLDWLFMKIQGLEYFKFISSVVL
jgi:hypothetical protein